MIYLFDKDEKLIKIVRKSAVKTALQKYALTTERYVSDRLTVELKGLNADELEQVEYMAIQTMEDAHTFHYFYVAQKFSDELTTLIGVQSGIEELRKSPVYDKRPQNALARDVITDLLAGTNWQARFVGETTPHSTNFYYTSVFDALKKVCEVWDLEMQFFVEMNGNHIGGRYIDFKRRIGEAVGKRVVYGHNALQILQEVERTNIFTALIGRGKGEETSEGYGRKITFENVVWSRTQGKPVDKPKGQKYLELPLMTRQYGIKNTDGTMRPKIGFVDFSEEDNPEILIERTYKALVDSARPQLTLKTSSVYLKGVKVGDTIRVVRHDKKLDYDTRIFEITFNRLNNQSSDIKLGDRIGESNEAKAQTIADKAVEQFVNNEFSNFVQNLPDYLPSADGFNNNWYGAEDPTVKYPGKVLINDIWYKPDPEHEGHKIMLRWTGEVWEEILRTYESEALRDRIAEEIAQVNQSMQTQSEEHDRQVADILSKTQSVEELANQAKTDAASAITQALLLKDEAIADAQAQVATVSQALNTAKTDLQNQVNAVDAKAVKVQSDANALRTDLNLQTGKILAQAQAQTALTSRVTTVETLADGTRSTVAELSKTVSKATGDIASVTSRTKTVEDTLSQTRTQYDALSQTVNAQTGQIDSINRKTADLQSGIDGVTERFENLQVGGINLLTDTDEETVYTESSSEFLRTPYDLAKIFDKHGLVTYTLSFDLKVAKNGYVYLYQQNGSGARYDGFYEAVYATTEWKRYHITFIPIEANMELSESFLAFYGGYGSGVVPYARKFKLEKGTVPTDWSPSHEDTAQEIAEYKRTADQNYAGLQSTVSTLDGKVTQNKTEANQTATQLSNRLTSLETYKDGESTRAQAYFEASKTETAKQLTAERTAIASNYVAKSIYDEDARGTTLKLNEIKTTADTAKQNLATYQETVDRKLTELTSSTQTLDGKISTTSAKVDTVAGQIRTEISTVEAKIPTEVGGRNLLKGQSKEWVKLVRPAGDYFFQEGSDYQVEAGQTYTFSILVEKVSKDTVPINLTLGLGNIPGNYTWDFREAVIYSIPFGKKISITFTVLPTDGVSGVHTYFAWRLRNDQLATTIRYKEVKLEKGNIATDWSPALEDLATVTALHSVTDTVDSHTRTIGAVGETGSILDNVSKVTQTANGLVQEVSGDNGLKTQVSTLAGSWAVKNLTNSGTVLNQLNLNKDGSVKIDGKLVQITGTTYIQDGVISAAKIGDLDAGKIKTGTLDAARIAVNSIDGSKLVFDQAFFNGLTANKALFKQLFAQSAFITSVQAVAISASNVATGILRATNGALDIDLDNANITFNQSATINFNSDSNALVRKKGDVTAFVNFADDPVSGGVYAGIGVTSHGAGVTTANNSDRGKFAGMRVYRPNDSLDLLRLIGDTITLAHGTEGKYFHFKPIQLRNNVDMTKLAGAVYTLSRIFMHLSANGWSFSHPSFIAGVKDEMARNWLQDFANEGLPR